MCQALCRSDEKRKTSSMDILTVVILPVNEYRMSFHFLYVLHFNQWFYNFNGRDLLLFWLNLFLGILFFIVIMNGNAFVCSTKKCSINLCYIYLVCNTVWVMCVLIFFFLFCIPLSPDESLVLKSCYCFYYYYCYFVMLRLEPRASLSFSLHYYCHVGKKLCFVSCSLF